MLNWRLEEREYIVEKIDEYYKSISGLQRIFMSDKQLNKNINYITEQAKLEYRSKKLDGYLDEIKEERKKINHLLNDINNTFNNYIAEQNLLITKNIKPFEMKVRPYTNHKEPISNVLEVVTIHCKPIELAFIQEKIERKEV